MLHALILPRWNPSQQEPLGPVELPSDVTPLPADSLAWILLFLGVFLLLHLYAKWLLHRKRTVSIAQPTAPIPEAQSLNEGLHSLKASVESLSNNQLEEALALSVFVRRVNGEQWSATDEELLERASSSSREALKPLLEFITRILFARRLATPEQWSEAMHQTEALVDSLTESQD